MSLGGLSYPNESHLKKIKKKKKPSQMVGSVGSYTILQSYAILHDPTYDPTIFVILLRF